MASIEWEPNVGTIVYGELIEESIFSARAIYQDADGDDYSPKGTYTYTSLEHPVEPLVLAQN